MHEERPPRVTLERVLDERERLCRYPRGVRGSVFAFEDVVLELESLARHGNARLLAHILALGPEPPTVIIVVAARLV